MTDENRVRKPRQARSKATVEAILEGAAQVLRVHGLDGCTTARVAERAGVSVGSLYQYFGNKEAIYDALCDRHIEAMFLSRRSMLRRELPSDELGTALTTMMEELLRSLATDPALHRQLRRHEAITGQSRLANYLERLQGLVAEQLRRHADLVRALDPDLAARILVDATAGVIEPMAREDPEQLDRADVRREITALVAGYLSPLNPVVAG